MTQQDIHAPFNKITRIGAWIADLRKDVVISFHDTRNTVMIVQPLESLGHL